MEKDRIEGFCRKLLDEKTAHLVVIQDGRKIVVSCAATPEHMFHFIVSMLRALPQMRESVYAAAEYIRGEEDAAAGGELPN